MSIWNEAAIMKPHVRFGPDGLYIEGRPVVVLCASLFYFRIPRDLWRDRLSKVKQAGYNAVDVYFPWNYHELEPGIWDFTGERDVEAFLRCAAEEGLWVVARPGPYICSEWDGGALPAYLFTDREMRLRDNDAKFLNAAQGWYSRILPLLRRFELGREGTVIGVQLDNELDFYDCGDPRGYISALRDMALAHGIGVPLFACAGQGNLFRASGYAEGVTPTCNFYPNDRDPAFEDKVVAYDRDLEARGYPLLVTETNRSHFLLRRLLGGGAKLLGPYLQASGTDFGFTNAINNWGKPLAFLTSDYDFHGMITPTGEMRPEAEEGLLLGSLLGALGEELALAVPVASPLEVETALTVSAGMTYALQLGGGADGRSSGGYLLSLPNVDASAGTAVLRGAGGEAFPRHTELVLAAGRCPLLPYALPLSRWGSAGKLLYATAELVAVETAPELRLVFCAEAGAEAELALELPPGFAVSTGPGLQLRESSGGTCVLSAVAGAAEAAAELRGADGAVLRVAVLDRGQAVQRARGSSAAGQAPAEAAAAPAQLGGFRSLALAASGSALLEQRQELGAKPQPLEELGIYRGLGWYGAERSQGSQPGEPVLGVLLQDAADVLSVYCDGTYAGTAVPGGGSAYIPVPEESRGFVELVVRAEIWGHTNFDDNALPGLRLQSLKGLQDVLLVTKQYDLTSNWQLRSCGVREYGAPLTMEERGAAYESIVSWGGWMTSRRTEAGLYRRTFLPAEGADAWVLHLPGIECTARAYVNGQFAGEFHGLAPYLDITEYVTAGQLAELTLYLERNYHRSAGRVVLFEGRRAGGWWCGGAGEQRLWAAAEEGRLAASPAGLPLTLAPGETRWLHAELSAETLPACRYALCQGRNAKLTAFLNGRLVGRIWLPGAPVRPHFTGGSPDRIYLPGPWQTLGGSRLAFLVEALEEGAELTGLLLEEVPQS